MRPDYRPSDFTVPAHELEHFDDVRSGKYGGSEDVLDQYDGPLTYYRKVRVVERDGKRWILLQHSAEYAVEVELTRQQMGDIRPLAPEDAWRLARELDHAETRYPIEEESGSVPP